MTDVVIVDASRTAIGNFLGSLTPVPAVTLGSKLIETMLKRTGIDQKEVNEVIMGNVLSCGLGQNPSRQASIYAGLPAEVPAFTVNKVCGSGMKAVALAAQAIKCGDADTVVAGGMENMSQSPFLLKNFRGVKKLRNFKIDAETAKHLIGREMVDSSVLDGIWCKFNDIYMGNLVEMIVEKYKITRKEQDDFSFDSNRKSIKAIDGGNFKDEIVPVEFDSKVFDKDERPRRDISIEKLSQLEPAFKAAGTITAGNSCGLNDGAAALVVMSSKKCDELGMKPLARIEAYASVGIDPKWFGLAPIYAVKKVLEKSEHVIDDFDLVEINEPFAAEVIAVQRELGIDPGRLNVNGGAIALGHPIGASGARILVTLINALKERRAEHGMATICLGGGGAVAMGIEMM